MSTNSTVPEKTFHHYEELPLEMRMMVINEMDPVDRCLSRRCSKASDREARASRNFLYSLQLTRYYGNYTSITVSHKRYDNTIDRRYSFYLEFKKDEVSGQKYMKQIRIRLSESQDDIEMWRTELDESTDLIKFAEEYFKKMLETYQSVIKSVVICDQPHRQNQIFEDIESLPNLEVLEAHPKCDIPQILSLTRKPLSKLCMGEDLQENGLAECEEIYKIRKSIYSPGTRFNNSQFLRLSASHIHMHIGSITPENIHSFVTSWQNGTLGKEVLHYCWRLTHVHYDLREVMRLFGINPYKFSGNLEIKHSKEDGKVGTLSLSYSSISFSCFPNRLD